MKYLIPLILMVAACSATPVVPSQTDEIGFRIRGAIVDFDRKINGKWNAIVQEVTLDDGTHLVEGFRTDGTWDGFMVDRHAWPTLGEVRRMKVYLAVVEEADWSPYGFCHLPENMDGSVKTTVSKDFNGQHQMFHKTKGKITAQSDEYFTWRIDATSHTMLVQSP